MSSVKKEIEIVMLLAMVKCVSEQCDILREQHKHQAKQKFNRMFNCVKNYEHEINKAMFVSNDYTIDIVFDTLMDAIGDSKDVLYKQK